MPTTTTVDPSQFAALIDAVDAESVKRRREIEALVLALVARTHIFLYGGKGVGKSYVSDRTAARIVGARQFKTFFDKFSDPSAVYGPRDMVAYKQNIQRRMIDGWMPTCHIAVIEEAFEASPAMLCSMLPIMNERRIENGGVMIDTDLSTALLLSNHLPHQVGDTLAAFADRIHTWLHVQELTDPADLRAIFLLETDPDPAPILTWAQIVEAQQAAAQVTVSDQAIDAVIELVAEARREHGVEISGRRLRSMNGIIRTQAWLAGASVATVEHVLPIADMLWTDAEQAPALISMVSEKVTPGMADAFKRRDEVDELAKAVEGVRNMDADDPDRGKVGVQLLRKIKRACQASLDEKAGKSQRVTDVLDRAIARCDAMDAEVSADVTGTDTSLVPSLSVRLAKEAA